MVISRMEIICCVALYFALDMLCQNARVNLYLSHYLRIPDARCPHCNEEVMNAFEKSRYWGKSRVTYFQCPFCEGWSRFSAIALALIAVPIGIIVLIVVVQVQALWLRVLVYFIAISTLKYLEARMDNLAESVGPLL